MNRQTFLRALGAAAAATATPFVYSEPLSYTAKTAPDAASRNILARPRIKLLDGSTGEAFAVRMHAMFPSIIEHNFATATPEQVNRMMLESTDKDFAELAQLYNQAVRDAGLQGVLTEVLAARLGEPQLVRAAAAFGKNDMYEAVMRAAPQKLSAYASATAGRFPPTINGMGQYMDKTLPEIYRSFRYAPAGGMAISGALWETGAVLSATVVPVAYTAWWAGTQLADLIRTEKPGLWEAIGGTIDQMRDNIMNGDPLGRGSRQNDSMRDWGLPTYQQNSMRNTGGDYGVVDELRLWWQSLWTLPGDTGCNRCNAH